ncbi:protein PIGBOS1 [Pempheris klunzingeri]|uniref:protein PIGBOS1 n=1 Tax=Pempheris klunzingeri TaxID=3127111 RepID=UPI00397F41FE
MFRKRLPFSQIVLATVLGVSSGIYIYKPCFEPVWKTSEQQNQDVPKKQDGVDSNN